MPPKDLISGGGPAGSTILPLMAICLLIACVLILVLPRNKAIFPFVVACVCIPRYQIVALGPLHFSPMRILILFVLAKMLRSPSGNKLAGGFNAIDKAVVLWTVTAFLAFVLRFHSMWALIQGVGDLIDRTGGFFAVRFLIFDGSTLRRAIKALAVVCVIEGGPMIVERIASTNIFGYFAGVRTAVTIREGKVRAEGTLGYLTAGSIGGTLIPLFVWLWKERESRRAAIAGLVGATAMVITSNSSTSQMALLGAIAGLALWPRRKKMRSIRWAVVCVLVVLQMVMKAPVWALIARVDLTGSSSSWHRYFILDNTIRHFSDWWLMGTTEYLNWGWDAWDTCNQFVDVALKGGLVPLIFFILILKRSFGAIGRARRRVEGNRAQEWFLWCFGVSLFAAFTAEWGINYSDILLIVLFVQLVLIMVAISETTQLAGRKSGTQRQDRQIAFSGSSEENKSLVTV